MSFNSNITQVRKKCDNFEANALDCVFGVCKFNSKHKNEFLFLKNTLIVKYLFQLGRLVQLVAAKKATSRQPVFPPSQPSVLQVVPSSPASAIASIIHAFPTNLQPWHEKFPPRMEIFLAPCLT